MADKKTEDSKTPVPSELKDADLDKVAGAGKLAGAEKDREK